MKKALDLDALIKGTNATKNEAKMIVANLFEQIKGVGIGEQITFIGFGSFSRTAASQRKIFGKELSIASKIKFSPSKKTNS